MIDTLTAADRVNLLELYARSAMLLDLGRCEEWADLFECRAIVRCSGHVGNVAREFVGHDQLLQLARDTFGGSFNIAIGDVKPPARYCHIVSNVCLFADGNRNARGCAHLAVTTRGGIGAPRWLAAGLYFDRLWKCTSGCWQFQSRTFTSEAIDGSLQSGSEQVSDRPRFT